MIGGIAGLVWPDWRAVHAAPITLPDPYTKPPAIVQQKPASPVLSLSPLEARTTATTAVNQVTQIADKATSAFKHIRLMEKAIQRDDDQIKELENRKRTALMELRRGEFCSKCGDTRLEIEQKYKISFEAHLTDVGATGIVATPDQIAKKAREYDAQIAPLQKNQQQVRDNLQKVRGHISDIQDQIHEGIALWRAASITDRVLTAAREEEARRVDLKELIAARDRLAGLIAEADKLAGDPNTAKSARASQNELERQTLRSLVKSVEDRSRTRQTEYWREVGEMQAHTKSQEHELSKATKAFIDSGQFRVNLPTFKISVFKWTVHMSENEAGFKFQGSKMLSLGFDVRLDRDTRSMETRSFFELFGKAKAYGGLLTEDGRINLTPVVGIDLPESEIMKDKPKLKIEPPRTDDWKIPQPGDWKKKLPIP